MVWRLSSERHFPTLSGINYLQNGCLAEFWEVQVVSLVVLLILGEISWIERGGGGANPSSVQWDNDY